MKIFISQPMNGKTDEDIVAKRETLIELAKKKYGDDIEVIDSFTKDPELEAKGQIAMLGHSVSMMADADLVVFAKDWTRARGCRVEQQVAKQYEIPILFEHNEW